MEVLNIFSDGAGSQFKQKYLFSNLYVWEQDYSMSIRWNFLPHLMARVWRRVKSDRVHIISAEQYAVVAAESCPNINGIAR